MVEVPEHLEPADRLCDADIEFAGLDVAHEGAALVRFNLFQGEAVVGKFKFMVFPEPDKGIADMIVDAHEQMTLALRQMLYRNDVRCGAYEKQSE